MASCFVGGQEGCLRSERGSSCLQGVAVDVTVATPDIRPIRVMSKFKTKTATTSRLRKGKTPVMLPGHKQELPGRGGLENDTVRDGVRAGIATTAPTRGRCSLALL